MSLPQSNAPMACDYMAVDSCWYNADGPMVVPAGQTWAMPASYSLLPPVYGCGTPSVKSEASAVVIGPAKVRMILGVNNPSEFDLPMRPFRGDEYQTFVEVDIPAGQTQTLSLSRLDKLDESLVTPNPYGGWTMNPGYAVGTGRAGWPSLGPSIINLDPLNAVTVENFQFNAEVIR